MEKAQEEGLLVWLYDEDRYASGAAGGLVTKDHRFRARHLLLTCYPYGKSPTFMGPGTSKNQSSRTENGRLIARYAVVLDSNGTLASYRRLSEDDLPPDEGTLWYAYLEIENESAWWNYQTYVDTLNPAAIQRFISIMHERYAQTVGEYFGGEIPAIFTDEPQFASKGFLASAYDQHDLFLPWTDDLPETYWQIYKERLEDVLPEIVWELSAHAASLARCRYHDHLTERFACAFADTLGQWCRQHHLMLTGHMMGEESLFSQTIRTGEAMRSYRGFDLPGIDMLCDRHEYNTAKQAQSAVHQFGRPGVLSELYGVTNWDFDFAGHKAQGDWQAALGVTVRVHHLTWLSMEGEAKRDYPASIGYQSPWYQEYPLIENHFARLATVLSRGKTRVCVGVIHPIESFWLCFGPQAQTVIERQEREQMFHDLTEWLLFGLIDFDFIAESLLPTLSMSEQSPQLSVGAACYDVIIVPPMRTMRATTLDRLELFQQAGGTLIFMGEIPSLMNAEPSERARQLAQNSQQIAFTRSSILSALDSVREISVQLSNGQPPDTLLHQIRVDGDNRWLFLCNTDKRDARDACHIKIKGKWQLQVMETLTGEDFALASQLEQGWTTFTWSFPAQGSLLLSLEPGWTAQGILQEHRQWNEHSLLSDPVPITLAEPNVLLLDQARYCLDNGEWQNVEEVLRIDNLLRRHLGYPLKTASFAQPWTEAHITAEHRIDLTFTISTTIPVYAPSLALERAEQTVIRVDGQIASSKANGWFVDEAISTVPLPDLAVGTHEIMLTLPYNRRSSLEWCYLLGDFGVEVRGRHARIIEPVRSLAFGDWTRQGLPFYAGNVTYHCTIEGEERETALRVPKFRAPLLSVSLDGQIQGKIAFAPYELELGQLAQGTHALDITAYGNRINAFGCLHNADERATWFGPDAWRTERDAWAYEYQLKAMGILAAPKVLL